MAGAEFAAARIVEPPRFGRWFCLVAVAVGLVWIAYQLLTNPGFQWDIVGRDMLDRTVLRGVAMTIQLTFIVMVIGAVIGVFIALMRMSRDPFLNFCAHGFVWFFRGTPVLVQLIFWYNLAALFPQLQLGIPFGGPKFFEISATVAISSFTAALLGLGLNEGAYMAEIIRAGLSSSTLVRSRRPTALGYRPCRLYGLVVLPQAMKSIVPPTGNQVIGMLKYSSLASVVALQELMDWSQTIYSRTFETMPAADRRGPVVPLHGQRSFRRAALHRAALPEGLAGGGPCPAAGMTIEGVPNRADIPLVRICDVWKKRGANIVLRGVNLVAEQGKVVCLLGPSGAGKSTLLRCINRIEPADRGMIQVAGASSAAGRRGTGMLRESQGSRHRADIGMVFQQLQPLRHMSALENITEGPMRARRAADRATELGATSCWSGSALRTGLKPIRGTCPAGNSSASRSPGRWRCSLS